MAVQYFFDKAYRLGFSPWDRDDAPAARLFFAMIERGELEGPGRGLDLGCGTGRQSVMLAQRGWTMTGVDIARRAIDEAARRAGDRGVEVRFLCGDVTRLEACGVSGQHDLVLDLGCFHGMEDEARGCYVPELARVAAPNGRLLMFATEPVSDVSGAPRGVTRADLERLFAPGWKIVATETIFLKHGVVGNWWQFRRRPE